MINFEQRSPGPLRRLVRKAAAIVPMSLVPARMLPRIDRGFYRLSRGRTTLSAWVSGLPIVMLTTTGARTGQPRTLPVLGLTEGDRLVLIASNFGRTSNPGWYHNLRAHPEAVITWQGSSGRDARPRAEGRGAAAICRPSASRLSVVGAVPPPRCASANPRDHARAEFLGRALSQVGDSVSPLAQRLS